MRLAVDSLPYDHVPNSQVDLSLASLRSKVVHLHQEQPGNTCKREQLLLASFRNAKLGPVDVLVGLHARCLPKTPNQDAACQIRLQVDASSFQGCLSSL